jgi:hypothetical protein
VFVTGRHHKHLRATLGLVICYALALQAFLAAYGTAFAVARPDPFGGGLLICHGAAGSGPAVADSGVPASGEQPPCALCAVAAAGGAIAPAPVSIMVLQVPVGTVDIPSASPVAPTPAHGSGLARAPPNVA